MQIVFIYQSPGYESQMLWPDQIVLVLPDLENLTRKLLHWIIPNVLSNQSYFHRGHLLWVSVHVNPKPGRLFNSTILRYRYSEFHHSILITWASSLFHSISIELLHSHLLPWLINSRDSCTNNLFMLTNSKDLYPWMMFWNYWSTRELTHNLLHWNTPNLFWTLLCWRLKFIGQCSTVQVFYYEIKTKCILWKKFRKRMTRTNSEGYNLKYKTSDRLITDWIRIHRQWTE